jgi:MtN3 and saliva related transmembrane protein
MDFPFLDVIGFIAAFLTTIAFLPQVIKAWRTRSTKDVSMVMFLSLVLGITLWLVYGLMKNDLPIIVANVSSLCLTSIILYFKLRFG